jgi:molybdenum storage protein
MSLKRDESGRLHIDTPLMAESLMDKTLLERTEVESVFRPLPELNVIKLGGQSIIDRGARVVQPLVEEIVAAHSQHQLLVMTGGGTRSRHAYAIALDLGMPTGILAKLGSSISESSSPPTWRWARYP